MGTSDPIKEIIDVKEEDCPQLSQKLTEISKNHNAVLMACIAPYVGLKVSPTRTANAQMGLSEEFAVETAINQIQTKTDNRKLLLRARPFCDFRKPNKKCRIGLCYCRS